MTAQVDILRARPDSVCIEITNKCNLRCSYCAKADDRLEALPWNNIDMTDDMIDALYGYCKRNGIRNVSLSGVGETAMTSGWHTRIALFLDDPEIDAHLVSNFVRVFNDDDFVALTKLRNLQISFDSSDLAMVRKQRSKADLRTITYNIIRLRQKMKELGRGPNIDVNCTLSRGNIREIAKLAGFCRELGVDRLMVGEVMFVIPDHPQAHDTLDNLTGEEVILLARQIIAAEDALRDSPTALYLQDRMRVRIEEIVDQLHEGATPRDPAGYFHRRIGSSACRQPWMQPFVRADGRVFPCCSVGTGEPLGYLAKSSLVEIFDGPASRAIRAEILEGRSSLPCDGCTLAGRDSFEDFAQEIRDWQGEPRVATEQNEVEHTFWPGLLGQSEYPVVVENSKLRVEAGMATLVEGRSRGLHRVLFDIDRTTVSELSFRARPAGRRRLRLDFADANGAIMLGRAQIAFTRVPQVDVAMGSVNCIAAPGPDGWYSLKARFDTPILLSHINLTLTRDDNGVDYSGDGRSGLDLCEFNLQ